MLCTFKFTIFCPECKRKRVMSVPAVSIERAFELIEEAVELIEHPKYPEGSVKRERCIGKFKISPA